MRKFLLLCSLILSSVFVKAQSVQLYYNDFEDASSLGMIYQDTIDDINIPSGTPPEWRLSDFAYNSDSSLHVNGVPNDHMVYFITDTIDATSTPYISFSFWHVAKLNLFNKALLDYSIDSGQTWSQIPIDTTYQGAAPFYTDPNSGGIEWFNESSYNNDWYPNQPNYTPLPSWWRKETFDLTNLLSDLQSGVGHTGILIRFRAYFQLQNQVTTGGYGVGWFVDDVLLEGSPCELNAPSISFNFTPNSSITGYPACFEPNPEGAQVELPDSNYPIAAKVTDNLKFYDTGVDTVMVIYQVNGGTFDTIGTTLYNTEYRTLIQGLVPGDVVNWYMLAYDAACDANEDRMPDLNYNNSLGMYTFFIEKGLPRKCGLPDCGSAPNVIRSYPWSENFDNPTRFVKRTATDLGSVPEDEYWQVNPNPPIKASGANDYYGVGVNSGSTPSAYTGPAGDHTTGTGQYMYCEAANGGTASLLRTPCFDLTQQTGCMAFEYFYHMYGDEINRFFYILVDTNQSIAALPFSDPTKVVEVKRHIGEHQKSSTDPWQRGVFSLDQFMGKYIRVQFVFSPGTILPNGRSDMAVDDFRIFSPDSVDVEVIAQTEPKNGYCDFQGQPVKVVVRNNGCNSLSSIPLNFKVNSSTTTYTETATFNPPLELDDTATYTFTQTFPAIAPGTHHVIAWSSRANDANGSNDTARGEDLEYHLPISTFPFIEDFENATIGTQNLGNTNWFFDSGLDPRFKWLVDEEMTDERNTGPYKGYHWAGKYLYAASGGSTNSFSTYLRSKCLDFGSLTNPALYFYYHSFGADIDRLEVQVSEGSQPYDKWTTISTIINTGNQNPNELSNWNLHRVSLGNYASQFIKLRFKITRKGGGAKTNFALDKIMIFDEATADAGAYVIEGPRNRSITVGPAGTNDPEVSIANFGSTTLTTCTVHFEINHKCDPSLSSSYTKYFGNLSIAPGATFKVNLSSAGVTYPIGEFEAKVYTTAPNGATDPHSFNDTIARNIIGGNLTYNIPYTSDFDPCGYDAEGFFPAGGFMQWEFGKPNSSSPFSIKNDRTGGGSAWVTKLNNPFIVGTEERLHFPAFDKFDTVKNATLRFYLAADFGSNSPSGGTDYPIAATVVYLNANQWKILGENTLVSNIGTNWLGDPKVAAPLVNSLGGPGWVTTTNGAWRKHEYPLNGFSLDSTALLKMRLIFRTNSSITQSQARDGLGFDDFEIDIPEQNSVSPIKVVTESPLPLPGEEQTLIVTIGNTGEKTIDSCQVQVFVGGQPLGPKEYVTLGSKGIYGGVYGIPKAPKDPYTIAGRHTFTYKYKWPAALATSGDHEVCVVTSRPNNKPDQKSIDDSLCTNIPIMLEVDMTNNGQFDYCDDFEDPTRFQLIHKDAKDLFEEDLCWIQSDPTYAGGAHSGTNAWTVMDTFHDPSTNKVGYNSLEQAALFSPVFIVDTGIVYEINFWHWLKTEKYHDGGNVEYSFDGGVTWYTVGYATANDTLHNWFSDPFVTSLDQIRGGWTDSTGGWINSNQFIEFGDAGKIILRFRFASDFDINSKGWAIDDFCFRKDTTGATGVGKIFGGEEPALPEEAIVGEMVPNPAIDHSQLSFVFPTPQDVDIRVYNLVGQVMETRSNKFTEGTHTIDFNTSNWAAGVYFVNFEYGGKLVTRKLVVK